MGDSQRIPLVSDAPSINGSTADTTVMPRARYLNALIVRSDCAGILATDGQYQALNDGLEPSQQTEEERVALTEATMWQIVFDILKVQKSRAKDRGELDAANWAFSCSLEEK